MSMLYLTCSNRIYGQLKAVLRINHSQIIIIKLILEQRIASTLFICITFQNSSVLLPIQLQSAVQMVALVSPMAAIVCALLDTLGGIVLRSCVSCHEVYVVWKNRSFITWCANLVMTYLSLAKQVRSY